MELRELLRRDPGRGMLCMLCTAHWQSLEDPPRSFDLLNADAHHVAEIFK